MSVNIRKGNCLKHENPFICPHIVNSEGGWGAGFVLSISALSKTPEQQYRRWYNDGFTRTQTGSEIPFKLGEAQFVSLYPSDLSKLIVNIVGQKGIGWDTDERRAPIRYWAVRKGLESVFDKYINHNQNLLENHDIVAPLLGCGLAGGHIDEIYSIINDIFGGPDIPFYLYAFTNKDFENLKAVSEDFS